MFRRKKVAGQTEMSGGKVPWIEAILVLYQGSPPTPTEVVDMATMLTKRSGGGDLKMKFSVITYDISGPSSPETWDDLEAMALTAVAKHDGRDLTPGALERADIYPIPGLGVVAAIWHDAIPAVKRQ